MNSLITKSAILLSILTSLPLANASAELKKVPLILMDTGKFSDPIPPPNPPNPNIKILNGDGDSTHLGRIVSTGVFEKKDRPSGGFKGEIEGEATASEPNAIRYRLSAEFFPGGVPGIFYGVGTYRITGGTGNFEGARGFGEFIGLANFNFGTYNCFLRGVISY